MKKYFSIFFWVAATLISSFMFLSYLDSYFEAWLLSVMMLPGVLMIKYITPKIKEEIGFFKILHSFYLIVGVLYVEYLCFILAYWYLFELNINKVPKIIVNPVFLAMWLIFFIGIEKIINLKFFSNKKSQIDIEFISNRKAIKVKLNIIAFIESNDNEVWVHLTNGDKYRTKMRISQWQEVLEAPFIRIHRSYIVNSKHIQHIENNSLQVNNTKLDISRKYKNQIEQIV